MWNCRGVSSVHTQQEECEVKREGQPSVTKSHYAGALQAGAGASAWGGREEKKEGRERLMVGERRRRAQQRRAKATTSGAVVRLRGAR